MEKSEIQWTDATWNIARGCTKVNDDCLFCYMMREGDRRKYDGKKVIRTKTVFDFPLRYKETKSSVRPGRPLIFTSSLTDWFHGDIDSFRNEAYNIIRKRPDLTFQILTKRIERFNECKPFDWGKGWDNVWLGISAGNQLNYYSQIQHFSEIKAKVKFLSLEPLHGKIPDLKLIEHGINWVIVGGESGNDNGKWRYRPLDIDWIHNIIDQCRAAKVPIFVKQLGTYMGKEWLLKDRHAGNWDEWPVSLKIRQFPSVQ